MVFATGDTHGNFRRFSWKHFPEQHAMGRDDYMIICGDFGGVWDGSRTENERLDWLNDRPFTTLWIDGNHENYDMLRRLPVEEWHGGKVHRVRPNILHLMRGQIYDIDGYTFFTMGGASSHDIKDGILDPAAPGFERNYRCLWEQGAQFRIFGQSWWPEELPSDKEYAEAVESLKRVDWAFDYVITHRAPTEVVKEINSEYEPDKLTEFFSKIAHNLKFHYWLFGHYHRNRIINEKYVLIWEQIVQII